jgi:(E)-4-hydroxy-3-methylbut-2-enyl-diphosphate synthase
MSRKVRIGSVVIGGGAPIAVQSMTNTKTTDIKGTIAQIKGLQEAGCEIIRCSVPDAESAVAIKKIKKAIKIPLVADIHFDYRLAIEALKNGADKIRINPGNIGGEANIKAVLEAAKERGAAIRIGVNSGSLKKDVKFALDKKSPDERANKMVASLMEHVEFFEKNKFENIVVSLKASDVPSTIEAYKLFAQYRDYPLHVGVTEAGTEFGGNIKSALGIGILLYLGLGDTIRVSLSADPRREIYAAYRILGGLNLRHVGIEVVSCPTCARTEIDIIKIAKMVEDMTMKEKKHLKVAVMGCVVNGPGEAAGADIGLTGSKKQGIIFVKGKIVKKVKKQGLLKAFEKMLKKMIREA